MNDSENNRPFPYAGIVFDMDGLMYDTERIIMESWDETGTEMGYGPLGFHIFHTLGMSRKGRKEYFKQKLGEGFSYDSFQESYAKKVFARTDTEIPVKPGLYELLAFLKENNYLIGVATSSSKESALRKLTKSHLSISDFDAVICGDMVKKAKPNPEIYQIASKKLHCPPSCLIALEDSENGLKSALAAGMNAIMIPDLIRDLPLIEPHLTAKLDSLTDVISFLKKECNLQNVCR